jgi:hypothetical protein
MNTFSPAAPGPVPGEVLRFSRWYAALAIVSVLVGVALFLGGLGLFFLGPTPGSPPEVCWFLPLFGVLGLGAGVFMACGGWYLTTHKPYLVLGCERLQFWEGRHLRWEVGYGEVVEVTPFTPVPSFFGPRVSGVTCLGFRWADPAGFDQAHPSLARRWRRLGRQNGFDLGIPLAQLDEPPEHYIEAVQRCCHRFQGRQA